jgi:PIN domain nuclease of toxin-antitoxin system
MRLLLDTHVFIWWRANDAKLGNEAGRAIARAAVVFVSVVTAWEAAIKRSLGRLELPESVEAGVTASGFTRLPIGFSHAEAIAGLARHHNDPFDRMLVAQASVERLTLVTHDAKFEPYGIDIIWT